MLDIISKRKPMSEETKRKISLSLIGNQYSLGYKHSKETNDKISKARLGIKLSIDTKNKISIARSGMKFTKKHKKNISLSLIGNKCHLGCKHSDESKRKTSKAHIGKKLSKEHREKIGKSNIGKKMSEQAKIKISKSHIGEKNPMWGINGINHHNWKGGITPLCNKIRSLPKSKLWSNNIFKRDNYTCQKCKKTGNNLNAHHKINFAYIIKNNNIRTIDEANNCAELWDINNGITLCKKCHDKFHKKYSKKNNTIEQLYKFLPRTPNISSTILRKIL